MVLVVVIILVALGGWYAYAHMKAPQAPAPAAEETSPAPVATSTAQAPAAATITYTDQGFSPKSVTIHQGDSVTFVNNSSHGMWVASGMHPTHTQYDGTDTSEHCKDGTDTTGTFDECTAVNPGTSYTFAFDKVGTWSYHNHVHASDTGTIIVQ